MFGGTFDPPHFGHLAIAQEVKHRLQLDRVLLVVANDPWQKSASSEVTDSEIRLSLVERAVAGIDGLIVSDIEIRRGGESYMADTLFELQEADPTDELFLVVGSDAAGGLDTWKRSEEVMSLASTVVVERGGRHGGRPPTGWPFTVVDVPALEISSSDLRARFAAGRPVDALVPAAVISEITRQGLYGSGKHGSGR